MQVTLIDDAAARRYGSHASGERSHRPAPLIAGGDQAYLIQRWDDLSINTKKESPLIPLPCDQWWVGEGGGVWAVATVHFRGLPGLKSIEREGEKRGRTNKFRIVDGVKAKS